MRPLSGRSVSAVGRRATNAGSSRSAPARVALWKPARRSSVLGEELCRERAPTVSFVTHIHLSIMYKREDEGIFADGYANPAYALIDWK